MYPIMCDHAQSIQSSTQRRSTTPPPLYMFNPVNFMSRLETPSFSEETLVRLSIG